MSRMAAGETDVRTGLRAIGETRVERSCEACERFFEDRAGSVAKACLAMARRFADGGRLLVFGDKSAESDVRHVSVEFVHPVIVGKRALPALALEGEPAARLEALGRPPDIAMGISSGAGAGTTVTGLVAARERGLLTVALGGGPGGEGLRRAGPDHLFIVPVDDPLVVQEVHETLYHVLWELVHVFFEGGVA